MARNPWTENEIRMLRWLHRKVGPACYTMFERHPRRSVQLKVNELGLLTCRAAALRGQDRRTPIYIRNRITIAHVVKANQDRSGIVGTVKEVDNFLESFDAVMSRMEKAG